MEFLFNQAMGNIEKTYDLLGYGAENDAKLQAYLYPIPQNVSDYKRFVEK